MRLFLGINLPQEAKDQLEHQLRTLQLEYPQFNWVPKSNYHITLHFFGEVSDIEGIGNRVNDLIYDSPAFTMFSGELEAFIRRDHLLMYLGFRRQKKLEELSQLIKSDIGAQDEQFIPHITLSRSSKSSKQQYFTLKNRLEKTNIDFEFNVDAIQLYESILTPKHATYTLVREFQLQKK